MGKYINNFLWVQSESPTAANWFVIDSEMSRYSGSEKHKAAMSLMTDARLRTKEKHSEGSPTSFAYEVKQGGGLTQLSGNFIEKDKAGRPMVFVFTTRHSSSVENIIEMLKKYVGLLPQKLTLREDDMEGYRSFFQRRRRKNVFIIVTAILAFLLLIVFLILQITN